MEEPKMAVKKDAAQLCGTAAVKEMSQILQLLAGRRKFSKRGFGLPVD